MSEPIWNKFLTERDKAVFGRPATARAAASASGRRCCHRRELRVLRRAAEPILESIKRWRNSCGEDAWVAMPYLKSLIDKAHEKGMPVIYTTGVRRADNWDNGGWSWKNSRSDEDRSNRPRPMSTATRSWPRSRRARRTS